jgi:hypothetical protein
MTAKVNHPTAGTAQDYGDQAHGVITGTSTSVDGKEVAYAVLLDPATGRATSPWTTS